MDTLNFGIVFPLLPSIAEHFGANAAQVGSLATAFSVAQVIFTPILGKSSDRFGRRIVLLIAIFGTAASAALTGFAWSFPVLLAARAINGAAGGTAGIANAYIADVTTGDEKAVYISYLSAANSIGIIIGPAIGGVLSHLGFSTACYVSAALSSLNFVIGIFFLTDSRRNPADHEAASAALTGSVQETSIGRPKIPWSAGLLYGAGFLFMLGFAAFESVTGYFLMDTYFPNDATTSGQFYGLIFVIAGVTMFLVAVFIYKPLLRVCGERLTVIIGCLFRAAGFVGMALAPTPVFFGLAVVIQVGGANLIMPTTSSMLTPLCSKEIYGTALGYQQAAQAIGRIFAPIVFGYLYDQISHYISFYINAVTGVLGTLLILAVPKTPAASAPTLEDVWTNVERFERQQSIPPSLDNTPLHGRMASQASERLARAFSAGSDRSDCEELPAAN